MVLIRQNENEVVLASGSNIINCDLVKKTEKIYKIPDPILPDNLTKGQIEVLQKEERIVNSICFSRNKEYLVVSTENKQVVVFSRTFKIIRNFIVNRAASKVCFTPKNDVIVADKTGDVYLYTLEESEKQPVLLLGHLSVVLDVLFSECGNFIITCDRDEKIRVSHFPNAYNIASFCLGHQEFVTSIKLADNVLVSSSGDGTIRFWNFLNGEELNIIYTGDYIKDRDILSNFAKEMDTEKVDVTALPVTDMQIYNTSRLFIAVSIYNYCNIQLHVVHDLKTCIPLLLRDISVESNLFTFCLNVKLFILSKTFAMYKFLNENFIEEESIYLDELYKRIKHLIKVVDSYDVTTLYKRKYDNVQDYLDKKKQRLELKVK